MSYFTENTAISPLPKKNRWITIEPLHFYTYVMWSKQDILVPQWFEFDGASVPRLLWSLFPPIEPRTINAACVHDYLYTTKQYTLWQTDLIFLEALEALEMKFWRRWLMFIWLKLWSWFTWYVKPYIKKFIISLLQVLNNNYDKKTTKHTLNQWDKKSSRKVW